MSTTTTTRPARPRRQLPDADRDEIIGLYAEIRERGACIGLWSLFAPGDPKLTRPRRIVAAAICGECPVFDQCARLADIVEPCFGIWAGRDYEPYGRRRTKAATD